MQRLALLTVIFAITVASPLGELQQYTATASSASMYLRCISCVQGGDPGDGRIQP